ncbi:MAG: MFS transporter [Chloroflexota bacterium]|jgi:MFS family permease|nr:MFS transporter [Chloroflexota bacterium]MED5237914.1 MFS transporter [Chloroflexota bacterium]|tara:strand:+ start:1014 stop:2237 length:1224 start_codon:yes stop_codon:yes gene_type:complete
MNPIIEVLKTKDFKKLWFIGTTGMSMRWIEQIALGFYVYQITKDEFLVGLVFFFRNIPMLLFGAFIGVISDEFDKKNILKITLLITTVVYLLLTISSFLDQLSYFQICCGAFVAGLAWSFDFPIRRSLLSEIVDKRLYPSAIGVDMTSSNIARVIGPILAGIVLQQVSLFPIYLFGTAMFLMAFIACTKVEAKRIIKEENSNSLSLLFNDLIEGIKYIFTSRILITVLVVTIIMNFLVFTYQSQLTVLVQTNLSDLPIILGVLAALEGVGATLGTLMIANFPMKRGMMIFLSGSFLFGICIIAFVFSKVLFVSILLMIIGGFGMAGFGTLQSILIISSSDQKIRGRVLGILAITIGTQPIGAFLLGYYSREYGSVNAVKISVLIAMILLIAVTILYLGKKPNSVKNQ